jgi:two-component system, OmpR family, sensor histidine kinase TctE
LINASANCKTSSVSRVNSGVVRSSHLVHQLLRLARSEADIELSPIDIAQLAQDVARDAAPAALAAGVDFGYEGAEHITVQGNALLLREAMSNLIDNAVHYAGHGCAVTLRVRYEGTHTVLEVEDTGPGVSEADLPRIFERFYRASDRPGGAGLGLSIVQEVVQRHGGSVSAHPMAPHGLCIRIQL